MKLVIIYGPTAAGKYTVGHQLAELTGYKLFHNHLTVDVVRPLFGDGHDPRRTELLDTLRLDVLGAMAREDINTIFTVAYVPNISPQFIPRIIKTVTAHGGVIHFVQLNAPDDTLFERLGNESRHILHKPTDPEHLREKLAHYDCRASIDYPSSLSLDTSKLSPLQSAQHIIKTFDL
jgi:hypothetical protein